MQRASFTSAYDSQFVSPPLCTRSHIKIHYVISTSPRVRPPPLDRQYRWSRRHDTRRYKALQRWRDPEQARTSITTNHVNHIFYDDPIHPYLSSTTNTTVTTTLRRIRTRWILLNIIIFDGWFTLFSVWRRN